jgi:hypothetical protein
MFYIKPENQRKLDIFNFPGEFHEKECKVITQGYSRSP